MHFKIKNIVLFFLLIALLLIWFWSYKENEKSKAWIHTSAGNFLNM